MASLLKTPSKTFHYVPYKGYCVLNFFDKSPFSAAGIDDDTVRLPWRLHRETGTETATQPPTAAANGMLGVIIIIYHMKSYNYYIKMYLLQQQQGRRAAEGRRRAPGAGRGSRSQRARRQVEVRRCCWFEDR